MSPIKFAGKPIDVSYVCDRGHRFWKRIPSSLKFTGTICKICGAPAFPERRNPGTQWPKKSRRRNPNETKSMTKGLSILPLVLIGGLAYLIYKNK